MHHRAHGRLGVPLGAWYAPSVIVELRPKSNQPFRSKATGFCLPATRPCTVQEAVYPADFREALEKLLHVPGELESFMMPSAVFPPGRLRREEVD